MNKEKLETATKAFYAVGCLESASDFITRMKKDPDMGLQLDFFQVRLSTVARGHILALAQADIDAQLRDAKAAFEAL